MRKIIVPNVLIVDDDRAMTMLLQKLLEMEPEGFDVSIAGSGEEAIVMAEDSPPDVFMVDYHLVDLDGLELVNHLRNNSTFAQTPIIMASGLDVQREAIQAGVDLFLLKPFEPGELAGIILDLIG